MGARKPMEHAMTGTIRAGEIREVLGDVLARRKVPKGVFSFFKGELHLLIGSRTVAVSAKAGMTFYGTQAAVKQLEQAIDEYDAHRRNKSQIDIEELIKAAPAQ